MEEPLFVLPVALGFGPEDDPPGYTFIVRAENDLGRKLHGSRWVNSYRLGPPLNLPPPSSSSAEDLDVRREARLLLQALDEAIWQHQAAVARLAGTHAPRRPGPDPTKLPSLSRAKAARPNYDSAEDIDLAWADAYLCGVRYRSEAHGAGIDPDAEQIEFRPSPQEILSDAEYDRAWRRDQAVAAQWKLVVDVRRHLLRELQSGAISASVRPYDGGQWRALKPDDWNADLASLQRRFIYGAMDPDHPFPGRGKAWPSGWWIFLDTYSTGKPTYLGNSDTVVASSDKDVPQETYAAPAEGAGERQEAPISLIEAVAQAETKLAKNDKHGKVILQAILSLGWPSWPIMTDTAAIGEITKTIKGRDADKPRAITVKRIIKRFGLDKYR